MTTLSLYQVDAFADRLFAGNPAAVCPLDAWLPDALMQSVAAENNLAETAFFAPAAGQGADYELRWFTPTVEVDLCGHATLATAYVLRERMGVTADSLRFATRSGIVSVDRDNDIDVLDFPARPPAPVDDPAPYAEALGAVPDAVLAADKAMAVFGDPDEVAALSPDMDKLAALPTDGVIATAPGRDVDIVSRYFAPAAGIPEDPVTGSAHCVLVPYWAERLGKAELTARQISARGGELACRLDGERVRLGGRCALYLEGTIRI